MSAEIREFPLGDILSITTGRMLAPMDNIQAILSWMTGESLFTHQLPRAAEECEGPLLAQHPDLATVVVPDDMKGEDACLAWLGTQVALLGETLPVVPLAAGEHASINPLVEFQSHYPHVPIIAIEVPGE